jgi:hypothetical protein
LGPKKRTAGGIVAAMPRRKRSTRINERILVQVRCEIYNVFNHHAFRDVNRNISNPGFGQYTTPSQSQRIMQAGALVRF